MSRMKTQKKWLLLVSPIVVLIIGLLIAGYLQATKPKLEPLEVVEREWLVDIEIVSRGDQVSLVKAYGEILPQRDAEMRALVSGQVIEINPNFKDGGNISAGEMLIQIEKFDYESKMRESKAQLNASKALLEEYIAQLRAEEKAKIENRVQLDLAVRELERREKLFSQKVVSQKHLEDAAKIVSDRTRLEALSTENVEVIKARLKRQKSIISSNEISLQRSVRDYQNTTLIAPFDGYLTSTSVAVGKRLSINDRVARLLDLKNMEVMFHLPDGEYGKLLYAQEDGLTGRLLEVVWRFGEKTKKYTAIIERISSEIEAETGAVRIYAQLINSDDKIIIRPGAFVEVIIEGPVFPESVKLPENAVHENDVVYVLVGERLEKRNVNILSRTGREIIVAGELNEGDKVVITRFAEIGPGLKVRSE